jgi:tetratricopeptide (TPR) repeat protein
MYFYWQTAYLVVLRGVNMSVRFNVHGSAVLMLAFVAMDCGGHRRRADHVHDDEEAKWDIHHEAERAGRIEEALAGYWAMCQRTPAFVRACFDYARLTFEVEPIREARKITRKTILRFPNDALCQSAVKRLRRSYRDELDAGIRELGRLAKETEGKGVHDTVLFEVARLARSADDPERESGTLLKLVSRYDRWESQLWDDAVWRLIEIYRDTKERSAEKKWLRKLLDAREKSALIGSYNSPYHDDALLRLGEIQMAENRQEEALATFMELGRDKKSRLRDEGLLGAARVREALGDTAEACRLLRKIIVELDATGSGRRKAEALARRIPCPDSSLGATP